MDAAAPLRAYVAFVHADSGIRQELTDEAIATINEMSLRYRRQILEDAFDHDDDIWPPPWQTGLLHDQVTVIGPRLSSKITPAVQARHR